MWPCPDCNDQKSLIHTDQKFKAVKNGRLIRQTDWSLCVCCGVFTPHHSYFDPDEEGYDRKELLRDGS